MDKLIYFLMLFLGILVLIGGFIISLNFLMAGNPWPIAVYVAFVFAFIIFADTY